VIGYGQAGSVARTPQYAMSGEVGAAAPGASLEEIPAAGGPVPDPMRAVMSRRLGTVGGFASPRIRGYRRCPCHHLFPLLAVRGRPPRHCQWHRNPRDRRRFARRIAT